MDRYCKPYRLPDGRLIFGGAARNRRTADAGGLENMMTEAYAKGAEYAFSKVLMAAPASSDARASRADMEPTRRNSVARTSATPVRRRSAAL